MSSSSVDQSNARDAKSSVEGSKHTPGPWSVHRTETLLTVFGADHVQVVKTSWHHFIRKPYPLQPEAEANARLIAAAPDLLEALKAALPQLVALADDASNDLGACVQEGGKPTEGELAKARFLCGIATAADAAITKATGEPSPADTAGSAAGSVSHREEPK